VTASAHKSTSTEGAERVLAVLGGWSKGATDAGLPRLDECWTIVTPDLVDNLRVMLA
jgi:hypothetical protein